MNEERRALWVIRIAGTAVLVLGVTMLAVLPRRPVRENVPGFLTPVVGFELASRPAHVEGILGKIGTPERKEAARRMVRGTWLDFLFAFSYPALYAGIALFLRARRRVTSRGMYMLWGLAAVTAVTDGLENRELLVLCGAPDAVTMAAALGRLRLFTVVKWYALFAVSAGTAVVLWREEGWWRSTALFFGGAALVGFSSFVHLPAIEYGSCLLLPAWVMAYIRAFR